MPYSSTTHLHSTGRGASKYTHTERGRQPGVQGGTQAKRRGRRAARSVYKQAGRQEKRKGKEQHEHINECQTFMTCDTQEKTHPSMTRSDIFPACVAGGALALLAKARYSLFMQPSTKGNGSTLAIWRTRRYESSRTLTMYKTGERGRWGGVALYHSRARRHDFMGGGYKA